MEGCLASYTKSECDTVRQGIINGAAALNLAMKQAFDEPGKIGALVCEKTTDPDVEHDHVCPTGNEHNPNLDDGHIITIRVADPETDEEFEENCKPNSLACIFPDDEFEGDEPEVDRFIGDRTMLITMGQGLKFETLPELSTVVWTNDPDRHGDEARDKDGNLTGFFYVDKAAMHELWHALGAPDGDDTSNPAQFDGSLSGWDIDVWNERLQQCRIEETIAPVYCLAKEFRDRDEQTTASIY